MTARIVTLGVIGTALLLLLRPHRTPEATFRTHPVAESPAFDRALRPAYPYSVIPGGVYSPQELAVRLRQDPIAARHYDDFRTQNAKLVVLDQDASAYVSYRVRNTVFWTGRKLHIAKGETLLTDGTHFARTRCGNRLSPTRPPNASTPPGEPVTELQTPPFTPDLFRSGRMPLFDLPVENVVYTPPHTKQPFSPPALLLWPSGPVFHLPLPVPPPYSSTPSGPVISGFPVPAYPVRIPPKQTTPAIAVEPETGPAAVTTAEPAENGLIAVAGLILLAIARYRTKPRGSKRSQ